MMSRLSMLFVAFALVCVQNHTTTTTGAKNDYSKPETWLCRPGRHDACDIDLATTVIAASGKLTRETWSADPKAPIDCFYVYPTVSNDSTPNSDMNAGPVGGVKATLKARLRNSGIRSAR